MLIDTAFGLGDLKGLIHKLIGDKEIIVCNTHCHIDHVSGNSHFDKVYCHYADQKYIEEHPDLRLAGTYSDNGFSGTNFDRPGFIKLMEDVKTGKIQCIVVKDLSRFGRDYLETGYYLETILPRLNVRFIAITDDYDSSRKEDQENISVPLKNMVNAMYAKDMSKKILAAKDAQRRNGNVTLSKVAFGYIRSEDRHRQIVDCLLYTSPSPRD